MLVEQQQRVVADRLEVPVVGTALLLAVDRAFGRIHVENDAVRIDGSFGLATNSRFTAAPASSLRSPASLSRSLLGASRCSAIPVPLRANQAKRRVWTPNGIVEVLVACQAAVDRLPQQIGQRELLVHALSRVAEMLLNQFSETEPFVQSRTKIRPPSEVTCDPWKSTFQAVEI